jgi:hypothetical protein
MMDEVPNVDIWESCAGFLRQKGGKKMPSFIQYKVASSSAFGA